MSDNEWHAAVQLVWIASRLSEEDMWYAGGSFMRPWPSWLCLVAPRHKDASLGTIGLGLG